MNFYLEYHRIKATFQYYRVAVEWLRSAKRLLEQYPHFSSYEQRIIEITKNLSPNNPDALIQLKQTVQELEDAVRHFRYH